MNSKPDNFSSPPEKASHTHPLKAMSALEFAALGSDRMVFVRTISADLLASFVPEAASMPEDMIFQLIMGADGSPLLVADNSQAVSDWLSEAEVVQVLRH